MAYERTLTQKVKDKALELGYERVGIASIEGFPEYAAELIARGTYGFFIDRPGDEGLIQGSDPATAFPGAKSIISVVYSYGQLDFPESLLPHVGRAYLGRCYGAPDSTVNGARLALYKDYLHSLGIRTYDAHGFLQVPDRAVAARAGVVSYGRNNFAFADEYGSFIIVTNIVTDADLETEDAPAECPCPPDCRACIDACPTRAMGEDGTIDPRRCVLYNNFTPDALHAFDLRSELGVRIHGCDACQEACPRNKRALSAPRQHDSFLPTVAERFDLVKLLNLDEEYYEAVVRPIMFNYIRNMDLFKRNAAIAMGNSGDVRYIPTLQAALEWAEGDVRANVEWALERLERLIPA